MDSERKENLQRKIVESGMSAEEFILQAFEALEQSKIKASVSSDIEIKQVDEHLVRVSEMFVALCKSRKDAIASHEETANFYKDIVEQQKAQILDAKNEAEETVEEIRVAAKEAVEKAEEQTKFSNKNLIDTQKELARISEQVATQAQLIIEYKIKNENLSGIIVKNQAIIDQTEKIQADYIAYKVTTAEQIVVLNQAIADAENEVQRTSREIKGQSQKHQIEIERLHDRNEIGVEKIKIEMQKQYQVALQKLHDKYNQQIADLLQGFAKFDKSENKKELI